MKGKLHKLSKGWTIWYNEDPIGGNVSFVDSLPIHPDDLDSDIIRWAENGSLNDKEVEFEITDEFTHPELYIGVGWGDGIKYAKIVIEPLDEDGYPILGTFGKPSWDDIFSEIDVNLKIDLPIRLKNWLKNSFYSPIKK